MPRLSTSDQKLTILVVSEANLSIFESDPDGFVERFQTQDKCWVHHFEPEIERHSVPWKHSTSLAPKKAKVVPSLGKMMASVFWDEKDIVLIDYLQKSKTINGEFDASLLRQLQKAIKSKQPGRLKKGVLFSQDYAPAHLSVVAMSTVHNCELEPIDHLPYSPDLALSDYFLFPNKKHLTGNRYQTGYDVISAVENFFEGQDENFYSTQIQVLQHRWKKCVDHRRDYFEK